MLALKHQDLDVTNREAVRGLAREQPSLIINCASIEVDECEREPKSAEAVHVDGPRALAEVASKIGAGFLHFSTNYVFGGEAVGRDPYTIEDELRPVNAYGKAKAAGEKSVLEAYPRAYIIRTSWIYGREKPSFLSTVARDLKAGKRIRAVTDVWASTTYVVDLVGRIEEIMARDRPGTYHVVNQGVCTYYEFALETGRSVGLRGTRVGELIETVKEAEAKRLAARPRYTPMRCLLSEGLGLPPMREWHLALAAYVRNLETGF